ncbi:MAG TPA: hypothetical protein VD997_14475 [Phycisphaerales bacterium]|nr:hypothetical protein [Phycisphaerales bacterium]
MSAHDAYARELHDAFGYFATWLPTAPVALGEVGRLRGKQFERLGKLDDYGVKFAVAKANVHAELQHASEGKVELKLESGAAAPVGPGTDGILTVGFKAKHAVFFRAEQCVGTSIDDLSQVGNSIVQLAEAGKWDREYLVVTEILSAERAIILMASESGASFAASVKGSMPIDAVDLVNAAVGAHIQRSSGLSLRIQANGQLTPLFKIGRLRRRFLGSEFRMRGENREERQPSGPELFAEVGFSDLGALTFSPGDAEPTS